MRHRRLWAAAIGVLALVFIPATPAAAHGVGGRSDLPLPLWLFAYGAAAALLISFAALGVLWPRSRIEGGVEGRPVPTGVDRAARLLGVFARAVGLLVFFAVFLAAAFGDESAASNLAPTAIWVVFWVGLQLLSALVGDVWSVLSPFDTLAVIGTRLRRRIGRGRRSEREPPRWGYWPAAVLLFGFVWMELVYVDPSSPRALAAAMGVYTIVVLSGAALWGRAWLRRGEAFAAWFGLLSAMAPLYRGEDGRLRVRPPFAGLVGLEPIRGTTALVLVALGSTSFDGLSRTQFWGDVLASRTGWEAVPVATIGLLWMIGLVALAYHGSMWLAAYVVGRERESLVAWFVHSLVPIAFAYVVAHYFSLLVFEGQTAIALASDPLGRGWDLFGTAGNAIDYTAVSTATIAWVQAAGIVGGHVAGVVMAHDRAVARFRGALATRSQYPLLGAMVLYSVGGLALLLGA